MSLKTYTEPVKSGLLLIDKPKDFSSHDIIAITRRVLKTQKIGHSGTLDPMATGLLILLIGRAATKHQDTFLKMNKTYRAVLKLGTETRSWDAYGEILNTLPVPPLTQAQIDEAIRGLCGEISQQIPPVSAKHIDGKRMYELARKGVEMEKKFNRVSVSWQEVVLRAPDEISFTLNGSCGTYVRSLGYMLAQKLGTTGHLTALRRLKIGPYRVEDALDGNLLKQISADDLYARVAEQI